MTTDNAGFISSSYIGPRSHEGGPFNDLLGRLLDLYLGTSLIGRILVNMSIQPLYPLNSRLPPRFSSDSLR